MGANESFIDEKGQAFLVALDMTSNPALLPDDTKQGIRQIVTDYYRRA